MERKYFKNQAEIYLALLNGKKITRQVTEYGCYVYLKDGLLCDDYSHKLTFDFSIPSDWYEYTEPVDETKYLWVMEYIGPTKDIYISDYFRTKKEMENNKEALYPVARLNEQTKKVEWL